MTDCPWEVSTTNRYTITTYEAAVTARQRVKEGQVIKYLVGTLVPLTTEESVDLDLTNRNFSIVVSSRKKNSSIFLGPARFANHDCDANGRLVTRGSDGMEVVAVKNIEVGDEITVSYGDDYFGPNNIDCLCHTCERLVRNGWAGARDISGSPRESVSSQELSTPETPKGKRKRESELLSNEPTLSRPAKLSKLKPSPSKLQQSWTPPTNAYEDTLHSTQEEITTTIRPARRSLRGQEKDDVVLSPPFSPDLADELSATSQSFSLDTRLRSRTRSSSNPGSRKELKINKPAVRLTGDLSTTKQCPTPRSDLDTDYESNSVTIKVESVETNKVETDSATVLLEEDSGLPSPTDDEQIQEERVISTLTTTKVTKTVTAPVDDIIQVVPSIEPPAITTTISTSAQLTVSTLSDHVRIPGDYLLTRKLLAQPHDRWVQCHNERCQGFFIQPNGYQTRRECPRCERHSMLYGFSWPKTDPDPRKILERGGAGRKNKSSANERSAYRRAGRCGKGSWVEGGGDEEERVMDHRTVHRFVLPEDEKSTTRKGLLKMAEVARSRGEDAELAERGNIGRRRTDSVGMDSNIDRGSLTPDGELRRRSHRFVTRVGVYADS